MSMTRKKCDIAIVGSGFSGLVAANILADRGLRIVLLDENMHMGGQLLRSLPWEGDPSEPDRLRRFGFELIGRVKRKSVEILDRTKVLDIVEQQHLLVEKEESGIVVVEPRMLLLATGARERFLPFKGWTLPGVISTGAAQILMKSSGVLPSKEMLIAGMGPLLLAVAGEFLRHGGTPLSILDMGRARDKFLMLTRAIHQHSKVTEGVLDLARIFLARVPLYLRTAVVEARGGAELGAVVAAKIGKDGSILQGTERIYRTESLAVGYGFTPNIELAQLAGCTIEHDRARGGWVVRVGDDLETSVDRVFAAGEITGIAGALKSVCEGELAAYGMLLKMGREVDSKRMTRLSRQRVHHLRFGKYFNALHRFPSRAILSIPDEVTICRCEDVGMGDVRRAIMEGYDTPAALKRALRIGMGNCQGRTCAPLVYDILSALTKKPEKFIPILSVRSPVKSVAMRSFLR
jgi:NADPH-dependent 2,4-dienoyl-CoA reductase/sulfur reductase-like enzyme